jgi:hypothetical protein
MLGRSRDAQIALLRSIAPNELRDALGGIYLRRRDLHAASDPPTIRTSFYWRCVQLMMISAAEKYEIVRCYEPSYGRLDVAEDSLLLWILTCEYSPLIFACMYEDPFASVYKLVSEDTIFLCLQRYYEWTSVSVPLSCAVCSRARVTAPVTRLMLSDVTDDFEVLRVDRPASLCLHAQDLDTELVHADPRVNGLMLDADGMELSNDDGRYLNICNDCLYDISRRRMPRYALANQLNRGYLPVTFEKLTWVEEMVCSIYRTNAVVTRLFHSSNERYPLVIHVPMR